jgi:hypothetical protein
MRCLLVAGVALVTLSCQGVRADDSIDRGLYISIIGGCQDCHTEGYHESGGAIDPDKALRGNSVGFQGDWGTTYPPNLRLTVAALSEDGFINTLRTFTALPPMPWYNVRHMKEDDQRALYRYIKSLGEPGSQAPQFVPPGEVPKTVSIVLTPLPPPACTSDFDCSIGKVCGEISPRQCVDRK